MSEPHVNIVSPVNITLRLLYWVCQQAPSWQDLGQLLLSLLQSKMSSHWIIQRNLGGLTDSPASIASSLHHTCKQKIHLLVYLIYCRNKLHMDGLYWLLNHKIASNEGWRLKCYIATVINTVIQCFLFTVCLKKYFQKMIQNHAWL